MVRFFKNYPVFFSLTVFAFIIIFSFGQSTGFALWQDDNALIFKLQHLDEQAGVFGPGPLGLGAYRYIAVPYILIYKIFGTNVAIFYIWAIFFYFLAAVSVFFLAKELTKNSVLALLSGSIFSAGFIGSDGILRLFNSVQTSYSIIFVSFTFLFLYRFIQTKLSLNYFFTLSFFALSLETAFIRTQYLIFPIIFFFLPFSAKRKLVLLVPFLVIYYFIFSKNPDPRMELINEFVASMWHGQLQYLHGFFGSLGNIIIAKPINDFLFPLAGKISLDYDNRLLILEFSFLLGAIVLSYFVFRKNKITRFTLPLCAIGWFALHVVFFHDQDLIMRHSIKEDISGVFANFIGGLFLVVVSSLCLLLKDKQTKVLLIFLLSWMLLNITAYSIYLPFSPLESIHRYLVHSLAAYAIFIPIFVYYLWGRNAAIVISCFIIFSNIVFSINYQYHFIVEKSIPTNKFYGDFKRFVPKIPKGTVLYFDVAEDEVSQQQFRDFFSVASMPDSTAIAIRYEIDRYDFGMTNNFEEFISLLDKKPLDYAFSFFYSPEGLKNTTDKLRFNLYGHNQFTIQEMRDLEKLDFSLVTPAILEFIARVLPDVSVSQDCIGLFSEQRKLIFEYILSRDNFLSNAKISTSSQEKYQKSDLLLDGNPNTLWRGNRGWWHNNENEEITIDLGVVKNISQLTWINGYANSTPLSYTIETSLNGAIWDEAKKVVGESRKENGAYVIEDFAPRSVQFLRLNITHTFDNDSPAIGEVEVVESGFSGMDKNKLSMFEEVAYCATNVQEKEEIIKFLRKRGVEGVVSWKTDKSIDNKVAVRLRVDGNYHTYKVFLPAGGTKLRDLKIEPRLVPAKVSISGVQITHPKFDELVGKQD